MFGMETPFLLLGVAFVLGTVFGWGFLLKWFSIKRKKNEDSNA